MSAWGLNILAQFVHDRARLERHVAALRPAVLLVMDDPALAGMFARRFPATTVIHRRYHPDDPRWHETVTPRDWLRMHAPDADGGHVVVQVLNEPQTYADCRPLAAWTAELVALASAQGIRLCVGNVAVGHPDTERLAAGEWDVLLRALARHPEHLFGTHEYFEDAPETPWKIGRYRLLRARAAQVGLPAPRIVLTECGRDVGGGAGDGWRGAGWSEAAYLARLRAAMALWRADGVPVCIFGYGTGAGGRWGSFDLQDAEWLLARLAEDNASMTTNTVQVVPKPDAAAVEATVTTLPGAFVNLRSAPSTAGADRGDLRVRDRVRYYPTAPRDGWVYVEQVASGVGGWVALQNGAVGFTADTPAPAPVPVPVPPVDTPPVVITMPPLPEWLVTNAAERARMSAWLRWLADVVDTAPGLPLSETSK